MRKVISNICPVFVYTMCKMQIYVCIRICIWKKHITWLLSKINESSLFQMDESQLLVGNHGQYTPAIGAALYYIKEFLTPAVS